MVHRNAVCSTSGGNASDEGLGHGAGESPTTRVRQARQLHSNLHWVSHTSDHYLWHGAGWNVPHWRRSRPRRGRWSASTVRLHTHALLYFWVLNDKYKKTVVYIHLNGDIQWLIHQKQQKLEWVSMCCWIISPFFLTVAVFDVWVTVCRR